MLVFRRGQLCESHDRCYQCLFVNCFSPLDALDLPAFLGAKSTRETAKENFSAALEEYYVTGLTQAMRTDPRNTSRARGARFKAYEAAIVATLNMAHAHRNDILKKMDDANSRWDRHYK
jgi:hypothetical protein